MESDNNFSTSGLYWLCKEAENRSSAADSPAPEPPPNIPHSHMPDLQPSAPLAPVTAAVAPLVVCEKRKRGRPPKGEGKAAKAAAAVQVTGKRGRKKKEKEEKEVEDKDEDVCFICFDGGSLVVCDRGDCPKAYHPACIKRDEAFFRSKARWTCGWHICSRCQKSASRYMCYTCTYSLCKGCSNDADYLCVRGNKGLCSTCYRVVLMIENIDQGNQEKVKVDFDDQLSWEYLFKVYWICLKRDLSLTVDEITHAQRPSAAPTKVTRRQKSSSVNHHLGNNGVLRRDNPTLRNQEISCNPVHLVSDNNNHTSVTSSWASKKLLDFVAHMRNGDTSALSQKEVQVLLFDYVKRENLRDPHQRSEIVCDPKLENLFGKRRVRHFEMLSLLEFHYLLKDNAILKPVTGDSDHNVLPMINANDNHKVDGKDGERVDVNAGNEGENASKKLDNHVDSSSSTNNFPNTQACLKTESISEAKSETSVASSANVSEAENSWLYRDPNGKVQGPFGIEQFQNWSLTGIFPPDMRIWRLNTEECESVLLGDVVKRQIPLQSNLSPSLQEVKGASDSTSHQCDDPCSGKADLVGIDTEAHSDGKVDSAQANRPVTPSILTTPVIKCDSLINNDGQIDSSLKCRDSGPEQPKVIKSYPSQPQEHSVEQLSAFTEKPHVVHENRSNVGQKLKSNPNRKNKNSQKKTEYQIKGRSSLENQTNKYVCKPSSDGPLSESSSPNNMSSHESHPHRTSLANLPNSSKQKFINLQEFPVRVPMTGNVNLPIPAIKEGHCVGQPYSDQSQNSLVNNFNVQESYPHYKTKANLTESSEQKFGINLQNFPMPLPEARTVDLAAQNIREQQQHINQINEQQYLSQASSSGPVSQHSSESYPHYKTKANLTESSEQKFGINLQSFPMPLPEARTVDLAAQNIREQQQHINQINEQRFLSQATSSGPVSQHSSDSYPHYKTKANLTKSSEKTFGINLQNFPMPMPEARTVDLAAQNIREQQQHINQINEQQYLSQTSSIGPPPQHSSVNNLDSHVSHSHYPSKVNFTNSSERKFNINLQDFPMSTPEASTEEFPAQTIQERKFRENFINEQRYTGHPSSDGLLRQNTSVNNLNSHKSHTRRASSASLPDSSEQRFSIDLQVFPMPLTEASTEASPVQIVKEQQWEPPQVSVQNLSFENVLSLTPKSIDEDKQRYFSQSSSDVPSRHDSSVYNLNSHYASMANITGSSEQKSSRNLQDFSMPMPKASNLEFLSQAVREQPWEPAQVSTRNMSVQHMLSLTPRSIDHDETENFRNHSAEKQVSENNLSLSQNFSRWNACDLVQVGGVDVSRKVSKSSMEDWDSDFLSVSSINAVETENDQMKTQTSKRDKLPPPSPPNPVPNASSWLAMVTEPIEFDTLAEESVSDLLAEVDAMESNSDLASPNPLMDYADDLFHDSKTNFFASLRGLSPPLDQSKMNDLSTSGSMMLPCQSTMKEEPIQTHNNTIFEPLNKPRKNSSASSAVENDTYAFKHDHPSSSGNIMLPPRSTVREEPIQAKNNTIFEPCRKPRTHPNTSSVLEIDAFASKNHLSSSGTAMQPPQYTMKKEPNQANNDTILEPFKKPRKHSNTSSVLEVDAFASENDQSSSGNILLPSQSNMREEPIQANDNNFEPFKKPRKRSNTNSVLEVGTCASKNDLSSSGNLMQSSQSFTREEPIRGHNNTVVESPKKPRKRSNTSSVLEFDDSRSSVNRMPPPQSSMRVEPIRAPSDPVPEPMKKPKKYSHTSSKLEVETKQFDILANKHNASPPKKTRELADIMSGPKKHDLKSPGSTRRDSGQGTPKGSGSKIRSSSSGLAGKESNQKHGGERLTSPRERNPSSTLTSPRDRNVPGGESGSTKGRPSWSRQSSFGSGGSGSHSRSIPRGRVCKFYENGYCRKGAFCEYLHP